MKRFLLLFFISGFLIKAEAQCPPTIICDPPGAVICSDTAAFLSVVSPTSPTYQWYKNNIPISDSTRSTLRVRDAGTYKVTYATCGIFSNEISVVVNQSPTGSILVSPPTPVCSGTQLTLTVTPSTYFFSWLGPTPPANALNPWTGIVTNSFVAVAVLINQTTNCSRVLLQSIIVHPVIDPGTISANQTICTGNTPVGLTGTTPTGGGGSYTYQWQSSIVSALTGFTDIPGATGQNYQPGALTQTTWFSRVTTSNSPCPSVSSNVVQITINPRPSVTSAITKSICSGTSVAYTPTSNVPGTSFAWTGITTSPTVTVYGVSPIGNGTINDVLSIDPGGSASGEVTYTITPTGPSPTFCAGTPISLVVTVKPLPIPIISGPTPVCFGNTGLIYSTAAGKTAYVWTIQGGVITAGQNTNTITVTWTIVGAQWVRVSYTENGCAAITPTQYNVTVNPLPVPVVTGPNPACAGSTGNVYSTASGMTNYGWTISNGGIITGGGGTSDHSVTVTWNNPGAQWVRVTYTDANGCTSTSPTQFNVNVSVPSLSGPISPCLGSTSNVYTTDPGMTNYIWTVSPGGTITAGGTSSSNTATVIWNATGYQTVTVNYTSGAGCTASSPTTLNINVNPLPTPTLTGYNDVCAGTTGVVYTTQTGKSSYFWTVSSGGTITGGGTPISNTVTVTWNTAGPQWVRVNYTDGNGCTAVSPTQYDVTVKPLPTPGISGSTSECAGTAGVTYSTEPGKTNYVWTISGGNITSSTNTNTITVTWTTPGSRWVAVNYTDVNGCAATTSTQYAVTVKPLPVPTISGAASVCINATNVAYNTQTGMTNYLWTVSGGGTITGGGGNSDNSVFVTWNIIGPQTVSVNYTGTNGCTAASATVYNVTVNPLPTPTISGPNDVCANSTGNIYTTQPGMSNYTWSISAGGTITAGGTLTSNTATVTWNTPGAQSVTVNYSQTGCPAVMPTTYNVTVNLLPTSDAGYDQLIPFGTSTTLTGTAGGGTPSLNYAWTPIASINGPNNTLTVQTTNIMVSPTDFTLTVTDSKGCIATDMMQVTLNGTALAVLATAAPQVICNNETSVQLNATASGGNSQMYTSYSWTSTPAGFTSTIQNPVVNPTQTTTYHISVYDGYNTANNSVTVTVNPLPTVFTVTGGGEYCSGGTGLPVELNGSQPGVNYQLLLNGVADGSPVPGTGSAFSFGNKTSPGTYSVQATNGTTTCQQNMAGSVVISVNPLPTAYAGPDQIIPYGISTTLTGAASGGTSPLFYLWTPVTLIASGETTLAPTTENIYATQTFTLTVTDIKGCTQNDQMQVIVNGNPLSVVASVNNSTICDGSPAQLSATGSGGSGTYTYIWNCNPAGTPPWSSTQQNPTVTPSVTTLYTVTIHDGYNDASASVTVIVNPLPTIYSVTGGGSYCSGGLGVTVGLSSSDVGVDYQLYRNGTSAGTAVPGTGASISFGNQSAAGSYTVKATRISTGCENTMTGAVTVTILPLPDAYSMTGGGSYPFGGIGVIVGLTNSQIGINYRLIHITDTLTPPPGIAGTGSPMNFGYQTLAGDYTAVGKNAVTGCVKEMLGSVLVIINPYPGLFNVFGGGTICLHDPGKIIGLDGSEIGIRYVLRHNGDSIAGYPATGDTLFFGSFTTAGVYTVKGVNIATGLSKIMNGSATIIVNPLPIAYVMGIYGDNCPGSEIMLNGSQLGANYILRLNLNPVDTLPGTGTILNFGPQSLPGNYTVYTYFVVTGCDTIMDGMITINPSPDVYIVRPPGVSCAGDTVSITGSQLGIIYQLQRNGFTNIGSPLPGTGLPISFGPQTVAGIYSVLAINPLTNCNIFMNGTANLNPLPNLFSIVPSGDTCAGVSIGLSGSQLGIKYILKRDTLWMDTLNGTGSPIEFGVQTIPGIYTIVGYDTTTFKFCSNLMLGNTILHPGPVLHAIIPSGFNCVGDSIGLANSDPGVSYQLILNGNQNAGSPVAGTGGPIWFGIQNYAGTYTIVGRNTTTSCSSVMTGTCILTPLPVAYNIIPQGDTCAGTPIGLNGSQTGINYVLMRDNIAVMTLPGTGSILSFGPQTISGTYIIRAYNVTPDSCHQLMSGITVIHQGPLAFNVIPTGLSCAGSTVGLSGSQSGVLYQLFRDGIYNIGLPVMGTGLSISFGIQVQPGIYSVTATSQSGLCWSVMTGNAILLTLPSVYIITPTGDTCAHSNIGINGSQAGVHYTLFRDAIYPVATINGTGGAISFGLQTTSGVYTIIAYNSTTDSCHSSMQGSLTIHPNPVIYNIVPSGVICVGNSIGLSFSQTGVNYQLFRDNMVVDTLAGNGTSLDFGPQQFPGVYTILAINTLTNCWSAMNGSTTIQVSPTLFTIIPTGDTCEQVQIGLNGSQSGVNYTLKRDGIPVQTVIGTGQPILFSYITTSGTYSIVANNTTSDTCTSVMNGNLIIHPLPLAYNVTPQGANCEPTSIGLINSQLGVNYELIKNGLLTGIILPGTNSALSFPAQMVGVYKVLGKYIVSPFCSQLMADSVVVSARPTVYAGPNDSVCYSAMTYQLSATGANYSTIIWTTSGDGFFTNGNALNAIYHLGALDKSNGLVNLTISVTGTPECPGSIATDMMTLMIDPLPTDNAGPDITLCGGQVAQLNGSAQNYSTVQWTSTGDGLFSNNSILNPTYTPSIHDVQNGTFKLILTAHGSLKCQSEIHRDTLVVSIYPLPTAIISGSESICEGDTASIVVHLTGTPPWSITYTNGVTPTTISNIGSSPLILQVTPSVTTTYTLTAVSDIHCIGISHSGAATILVRPKPLIFNITVTNGGSYCEGGQGVEIGLDNSQTGVKYKLLLGGIQVGNLMPGTGFPLSFGLFTTIGMYIIFGTDTTTAAHCSSQMNGTATIMVYPLPVVDFHADTTCLGQPTHFTLLGADIGKIATWNWNFGDGTTAFYNYPYPPTHTYPTYGDYQVVLQVIDTNGCERQIVHNIHVVQLPVSLFGFSTPTCQGLNLTFTDYSYSVPLIISYIQTWIWIFGDGSTDTIHFPASPDVTHQYLLAGNYQVTLKVINNYGCINQHSLPITIIPDPVANFFYGSNQCADKAVQFTDGSQLNGGGAIVGWQWNFGDPTSGTNNTSTLQNPEHVYAQSGTYSVNLIISSSSGCSGTITKSVQVQMKPKALFSANSPCLGNATNFSDQSVPNALSIISWDWNFGDGFPHSNLQNPVHLYVLSGQYNVTLSVTNSNQCTHDTTITVYVIPLPMASYQSDAPKCLGSPVYYSNLSTTPVGQIVKWHWNFGDGTDTTIFFPGVPNVSHVFTGWTLQHLVRLTVTTNDSCSDYYETIIQSIPTPVANFSYSSTLCSGQNVQFTDLTQLNGGGVLTGWLWDFDDPTSGTQNISYLQNPIHVFTSAGTYNVKLIVTNVGFCSNMIIKTITINPQPIADFSADTACFGTLTHFQDQSVPNASMIVTWDWDFGDGSPHAFIANPIHLYTLSGTYSVTLIVTNSNGCIQSKTRNVMVLPSPTASFVYSTNNCSGTPVQFTDQSTTQTGYIVKWTWNFGDGSITIVDLPAPPNVSHVYINGGTYNVTLTVKTDDSCAASVSHMVTVIPAPFADFDYPAVRCAGMAVQFTDLSQENGGGTIMNWNWNFGDPGTGTNNTSTLKNPFHIFSNGGTYQVQLIVTNTSTCKDTIVKTVSINNKPFVDFSFDTVCKGDITHFTDASLPNSGTITNWLWSFGDGTTSPAQNPTHQYSTSGFFYVVLTVTNSAGCSHDTTKLAQVKVKPSSAFSFTGTCKGSPTQFQDLSTTSSGVINQWQWDFGDGGNSTIQNPAHTYSTSGIFNVTLIVTNSSGCSDSITLPVTINPTPTAQYSYYNTYCPAGRVEFFDESTSPNTSIVSWYWEFEPGYYSIDQDPVYTYSQTNAFYPVTLIVTDGNGCKDTIVDTVYVKPAFQLEIHANDTCLGNPNQFHAINQAAGDPLHNFTWNFGEPGSYTNTSSLKDPQHTYDNPGTYIVMLKAWNSDNCIDSVYKVVTVYPGSIADFSYNPGSFCNDTTVIFTNLSSGNGADLDSLIYTFGDGTSAIKTAPFSNPDTVRHHYSAFGTYMVSLTAINTNGCRNTKTHQVLVTCMTTSFSMADTIICQNSLLALTDNSTPQSLINKWYWNFGDGLDTTYFKHCNLVNHSYLQPGSYNIKLVISTTVSGITISDSSIRQVLVKVSPVANFSSVSACLGDSSKFIDLSDSNNVSIISHHWKFGDQLSGNNDTSTLINPAHKYTHYGNFNPKLIVQNAVGCSDSVIIQIRVHKLPVSAFSAPDLLCSRTYIDLTDQSKAGDTTKLSWLWYLGDPNDPENISIEQDPVSYYDSAGTYDILLRIRDSFGCRDSITHAINILPSPISSFIVEQNLDGIAGKVWLTNTSRGAIAYLWDFGNGQTSRKENPDVISYENNGIYTIILIASSDNKCTDTTRYPLEILFRALYVPNALAPLTTDVGTRVFQPKGVGLNIYHVQVFDTWGHLLWESTKLDPQGKPTDYWDGTDQSGNLMPQGTYLWKISASFIDGTVWQGSDNGKTKGKNMGTVTLIR
jgi:PKD repeat protein